MVAACRFCQTVSDRVLEQGKVLIVVAVETFFAHEAPQALNQIGRIRWQKQQFQAQLPRFRPKCPLFDFTLKRPGSALVEARADPGTHRVLWDVPVVSGREPRPPVLSV